MEDLKIFTIFFLIFENCDDKAILGYATLLKLRSQSKWFDFLGKNRQMNFDILSDCLSNICSPIGTPYSKYKIYIKELTKCP